MEKREEEELKSVKKEEPKSVLTPVGHSKKFLFFIFLLNRVAYKHFKTRDGRLGHPYEKKTDFREFFLLFTANVRSRPPGPPLDPGLLCTNFV